MYKRLKQSLPEEGIWTVSKLITVTQYHSSLRAKTPSFRLHHCFPSFFFNIRRGFPGGPDDKDSACNAGDPHSIS